MFKIFEGAYTLSYLYTYLDRHEINKSLRTDTTAVPFLCLSAARDLYPMNQLCRCEGPLRIRNLLGVSLAGRCFGLTLTGVVIFRNACKMSLCPSLYSRLALVYYIDSRCDWDFFWCGILCTSNSVEGCRPGAVLSA